MLTLILFICTMQTCFAITLQYSAYNESGIFTICHFLKGVALNENNFFEMKVITFFQSCINQNLHTLYYVHQYYVHWHTVTNLHLIYIYLRICSK